MIKNLSFGWAPCLYPLVDVSLCELGRVEMKSWWLPVERWNIVDTQVRKNAEIVHQKGEEVACLLFQKPWAVGGGLFSLAKDN